MTLIKSLAAKHKAAATHWCTNDTTRTFTPSVKKGRFAKAKKSKCWEFDFSFSRCGSRVDDLFHLVIERDFSARAPFVYPHVVFPLCINPLQGAVAKRKEIVQSILFRQPFTAGEYFPNTPRLEGFVFFFVVVAAWNCQKRTCEIFSADASLRRSMTTSLKATGTNAAQWGTASLRPICSRTKGFILQPNGLFLIVSTYAARADCDEHVCALSCVQCWRTWRLHEEKCLRSISGSILTVDLFIRNVAWCKQLREGKNRKCNAQTPQRAKRVH